MALASLDAKNKLEDLSGVAVQPGDNAYEALIAASDNDPVRRLSAPSALSALSTPSLLTKQAQIQARYAAHRTTRNAQQRAKFLDPDFAGVLVDPVLARLEDPSIEPGFSDERHGLVFWARPPEHVLQLAARVQERLQAAAPHIWLMPLHRMHMTALEIMHSHTPDQVAAVVAAMAAPLPSASSSSSSSGIEALVNYPYAHRARLVKPMVSHDLAAVALSFVPAAGEPSTSPPPVPPSPAPGAVKVAADDAYTYHHLRRDLLACAQATGVDVAPRYVVPSAHITLGRFLGQADHATPAARQAWVDAIDAINAWLEETVWPAAWTPATPSTTPPPPPSQRLVGEWVVGQERGLDARTGALWYGGGRSIMVGEGF